MIKQDTKACFYQTKKINFAPWWRYINGRKCYFYTSTSKMVPLPFNILGVVRYRCFQLKNDLNENKVDLLAYEVFREFTVAKYNNSGI